MRRILYLILITITWSCSNQNVHKEYQVMTVTGLMDIEDIGITLEHEHITTDFIGAEKVHQPQYPVQQAVDKLLPFFVELKASGVQTLIECTPEYIGRDVLLLKELSEKSGINIITNTGYYAAVDKKYLPAHAFTETTGQLAERWINEWNNGIKGTGIKPGFIKLGVGKSRLDSIEQKIVRAGALAHLKTGLKVAIHTGSTMAAQDEIDIFKSERVDPRALIVIHAQNSSSEEQITLAKQGCWISLDGINRQPESIEKYVTNLSDLKAKNLLSSVLISHDNGWAVIQKEDGTIDFELFGDKEEKPYATIFNVLISKLKEASFDQKEIELLLIKNPAEAYKIEVCTL